MRSFKRVIFSIILLVMLSGLTWIVNAIKSPKEHPAPQGAKQDLELNQTKVNVHRSYWFFDKERPFSINMSYPSSHTFRNKSLIEEIENLKAEATDALSVHVFFAATGSIDYGSNIFKAKKVHFIKQVNGKKLLNALANTITVHFKESSPVFEALGIKAEVTS